MNLKLQIISYQSTQIHGNPLQGLIISNNTLPAMAIYIRFIYQDNKPENR